MQTAPAASASPALEQNVTELFPSVKVQHFPYVGSVQSAFFAHARTVDVELHVSVMDVVQDDVHFDVSDLMGQLGGWPEPVSSEPQQMDAPPSPQSAGD